jgi:N-acetyl-anhydromuramyl-L-alanine amidase AmpD
VRLPRPAEIEIDAWHQARGFARQAGMVARLNPHLPSIGYHFVIDLDGRMATGRSLAEPGAHVAGFNARSVGICMVGGADPVVRYTAAQWLALQSLVGRLGAELRIGLQPVKPGAPAGVCGHRDLSPDTNGDGQVTRQEWLKTCPGFDVAAWLQAGMQPLAENVLP